ncbi:MAG: fructose-6-phosphate aldolase [bacterium]|nr:fructose-6-phosphate aldolase [bacterium]
MKFFADTANIEEIKQIKRWGLLDGVTTNPTIISRENRPFKEVVMEILNIVDGPVNLEVISTDAEGMVKEAIKLASLAPNVVIKIPMTTEGIMAVKELSSRGIKTNVTLTFSPTQALIAAKAGANYVSPFIGRWDDISNEGMQVVEDILTIFNNYGYTTEIIVASVRHPIHILQAARLGAHIVTAPFKVLEQLFHHPLTDIGLKRFLEDWKKVPNPEL